MEFEKMKSELLAEVDSGLKYARTLNDQAEFEIYLLFQSKSHVSIKQGVVEATDGIIAGNAVRAALKNSVSFSSSSGITSDRIRNSIQEALASLATTSVKDKRFEEFCSPSPPGKEGLFSDEILALTTEDLVLAAETMVKEANIRDKRILGGASCSLIWRGFAIGNSQGLLQASRTAYNEAEVLALAIEGEERRSASEEVVSREKPIEVEGLGTQAAERALNLLGAKKLGETKKMTTLWVPIAAASYILSSLGRSANGKPVIEKQSPIAEKLDKKISTPQLTLIDDGQNPKRIATNAIDAEGHPQSQTKIIDRGILKKFLFDTYYGRIHGSGSTGNCQRGLGVFERSLPYETAPEIAETSLEVSAGSKSEEELISNIDGRAILIADIPIGITHTTVSTGEFSVVANSVYLIENGEKKWPLQPLSVSGNFYEGLKSLWEIGNNLETTPLRVTIPSLVFDGFTIVS
jgi:PmbA protein